MAKEADKTNKKDVKAKPVTAEKVQPVVEQPQSDKKDVVTAPAQAAATTPAPAPTLPQHSPAGAEKPKKKKSCLIIIGIVVVIYIVLQFLPFVGFGMFGLFGNNSHSYIPSFNSNSNTEVSSTNSNTNVNKNTNSSAKSKNTNSSAAASKPVTETPATPADQPPATTTGPQTTFTKQEEIDYFIKIAITDESNNYVERPLHRWPTTQTLVSIKYFDNFTNATDLACANETINILNSLSTTTQFKNDQNDPLYNIEVHFVPHSQIAAVVGDAGGYMSYDLRPNSQSFSHTYAYVPIDTYPDSVRCHFIRHEITHAATGLLYNLTVTQGGYHYSIFNVPVEGWTDYINIDKDLVKMMFNTSIPSGSTAASARTFLAGKSW